MKANLEYFELIYILNDIPSTCMILRYETERAHQILG